MLIPASSASISHDTHAEISPRPPSCLTSCLLLCSSALTRQVKKQQQSEPKLSEVERSKLERWRQPPRTTLANNNLLHCTMSTNTCECTSRHLFCSFTVKESLSPCINSRLVCGCTSEILLLSGKLDCSACRLQASVSSAICCCWFAGCFCD